MEIERLSDNGYKITKAFNDEVFDEVKRFCDTFTAGHLPDTVYSTILREFGVVAGGLKSKVKGEVEQVIKSVTHDFKFISCVDAWRDYPTYYVGTHVDDPRAQNIMIVYLDSSDDPTLGTEFEENGVKYSFPYRQNTGLILLNSDTIQHGMVGPVPAGVTRKVLYINWITNKRFNELKTSPVIPAKPAETLPPPEPVIIEDKPMPATMCMAPWTHTYLSPQTERRMCCASREPAQNFQQYIDTATGTGKYIPLTLEKHWNSDHMKSVRRRMIAGETLSECEVCNDKLLNTSVYRSYFNQLFGHKYKEALWKTAPDGGTTMLPVSWDYRFSNLCNFKCRMCGDMLSSAWETEQRQNNMIDWGNPKNLWMKPEVKKQIEHFQEDQVEAEFSKAVEEHRVEEVYWVGGEPLMYEQHWRYMSRIVELGDGQNVYARYNTNLSRVDYKGINLYRDILSRIRDWQICASIDGTGQIGEYIRTGLDYNQWLRNFREGVEVATHRRQMRIDFTLTLPGMFEISNINRLANELGVEVLAKVIFSFSPDIVMSPLALPRHLLDEWIDEQLTTGTGGALRDILVQLKTRPTFEEQWPNEYKEAIASGKARVLKLEEIRTQSITMREILAGRPGVLAWWDNI